MYVYTCVRVFQRHWVSSTQRRTQRIYTSTPPTEQYTYTNVNKHTFTHSPILTCTRRHTLSLSHLLKTSGGTSHNEVITHSNSYPHVNKCAQAIKHSDDTPKNRRAPRAALVRDPISFVGGPWRATQCFIATQTHTQTHTNKRSLSPAKGHAVARVTMK